MEMRMAPGIYATYNNYILYYFGKIIIIHILINNYKYFNHNY